MKYDAEQDGIELGSVVNKESNSGLQVNKRLLVLKNGCLYYYSSVPKAFKGDLKILKSLKDSPKSSIDIAFIHHIKADQKYPTQFEIEFEAKHMMGAEEIRKTMTIEDYNFAPKNTTQLIKWKFSCESKELRDRWVSSLNTSIKESIDIMKFMSQMKGDKVEDAPSGRKSVIPWKVSSDEESKKKEDERKKQQQQAWNKRLEEDARQRKLQQDKKEHEEKKRQDLEIRNKLEKTRKEKEREEKRLEEQRLLKEKVSKEMALVQEKQKQLKQQPVQQQKMVQPAKAEPQHIEPVKEEPVNTEPVWTAPQPPPAEPVKVVEPDPPTLIQLDIPRQPPPVVPQLAMERLGDLSREERFDKSVSNESRQFHDGRPQAPTMESPTHNTELKSKESEFVKPTISIDKIASWNSSRLMTPVEQSPELKLSRVPDAPPSSLSHIEEYYQLTNKLFEGSFKERIQRQLEQRRISLSFRDRATDVFEEIINELSLEARKRTFVIGQPPERILHFENLYLRLGMTSSKQIKINGIESYFFDCEEQKALKREFEAYSNAQYSISKLRREGVELSIQCPLVCLVEYKGVTGLVFYSNPHEESSVSKEDIQTVGKQLKLIGFAENSFTFKRLSSTNNYILSAKSINKEEKKPLRYQTLAGPVTTQYLEILRNDGYSVSLTSLIRCHQQLLGQPLTHRNKEIISSLEYCIYVKALRKIHRSGQAELDELNFWRLVFSRDETLTRMLRGIGCEYVPDSLGILLDYIRYFCGVVFEFTDPNNLQTATRAIARPITKALVCTATELEDTVNNFQRYLKEEKYPLARETLQLRTDLCRSKFEQFNQTKLLMDSAELEYREGDIIESIKLCKKALQQLPTHDPIRFRIYSQLLKNNEDSSEPEMLRLFKQTVDLTILNYGSEHSSLIDLYCVLAYYLDVKKKDQTSAAKMYATSLKLAEKVCGEDSLEVAAIYVDLSRFHRNNGRIEDSRKGLDRAGKLYSNTTGAFRTGSSYIKYLLYSAKYLAAEKDKEPAERYLMEAVKLLENLPDAARLMEVYQTALDIYDPVKDQSRRHETLDKIFSIGVKRDIKYARYSLERSLEDYLIAQPAAKEKILNINAIMEQGRQNCQQSLEFLSLKRKGYRGIYSLIEDTVSTLVSEQPISKGGEAKRTESLEMLRHIVNIIDAGYLRSLLGSIE